MPPFTPRSALVATGGAIALVGTFLPWMRSGERRRTSYDLSEIARRLDLATNVASRAAVAIWPAVPLALLGSVVLAIVRTSRWSSVGAMGVSAYLISVSATVASSPIKASVGLPVTIAGASALFLGALWPSRSTK